MNQSKTNLDGLIHSQQAMQDLAVLLTIETAINMAFCFVTLNGNERPPRRLYRIAKLMLNNYPCLMVFPIAFYVLTQLFFSLVGTSFGTITTVSAISMACGIPLLSWLIEKLLKDRDSRVETHLIVSIVVCVMGLLATQSTQLIYTPNTPTADHTSTLLIAIALIVIALCGYGTERLYQKIKHNKTTK